MRTKRIQIAYDGLSPFDDVLEDLRWAGLPDQAEAMVISVADVEIPSLPPGSIRRFEDEYPERLPAVAVMARRRATRAVEDARRMAVEAGELIRARFPFWNIRAESSGGSPAWELVRKADEWGADLIVVGPSGLPGRYTLGSVSRMVVAESPCSVRVVRGRAREDGSPLRIVIGLDGSPGAEAAVSAVARRAWPSETEVRVVAASEPTTTKVTEWAIKSMQGGWLPKAVEAAVKKLRDADLAVSSVVKDGDPRLVLKDEAEKWGADSIFVGARGLSRGDRFLVGGVSSALAARAPCSVEVVRAARSSQWG
jgi:nucleotide-binding universal stress UspA family protein